MEGSNQGSPSSATIGGYTSSDDEDESNSESSSAASSVSCSVSAGSSTQGLAQHGLIDHAETIAAVTPTTLPIPIPTPLKGNAGMIAQLTKAIDVDSLLKGRPIVIGTGQEGCETFAKPANPGEIRVLLT
jgi:hypothetical protein